VSQVSLSAEELTPDQSAVRRVAEGDADALAEIYDRHARPVFSLALRILDEHAEAEEVVQEVFSGVWSHARRYDRTRGSVRAWLLTMARSRAIDRLRARRARPQAVSLSVTRTTLELPDAAAGHDVALITEEQRHALRRALSDLPLVQRLAIELAYYEGLSQTEIAARLEQPLGTIKTRIRSGLIRLRQVLSETSSRP